jgi:hypothetical protein
MVVAHSCEQKKKMKILSFFENSKNQLNPVEAAVSEARPAEAGIYIPCSRVYRQQFMYKFCRFL